MGRSSPGQGTLDLVNMSDLCERADGIRVGTHWYNCAQFSSAAGCKPG